MKRCLLLIVCCSGLPGAALSSTPEAWAEHDAHVRETCLAASELSDAQVIGEPVLFSDDVGYTALMLQGHYPQSHMNDRIGKQLCLYNRQAKQAYITEADDLVSESTR